MMTEFQTQYGTINWFAVLSIHLNQGSRKVKNLEVCTIIKGRAESDPLVDGIGLTDLPKIGGANGTPGTSSSSISAKLSMLQTRDGHWYLHFFAIQLALLTRGSQIMPTKLQPTPQFFDLLPYLQTVKLKGQCPV